MNAAEHERRHRAAAFRAWLANMPADLPRVEDIDPEDFQRISDFTWRLGSLVSALLTERAAALRIAQDLVINEALVDPLSQTIIDQFHVALAQDADSPAILYALLEKLGEKEPANG